MKIFLFSREVILSPNFGYRLQRANNDRLQTRHYARNPNSGKSTDRFKYTRMMWNVDYSLLEVSYLQFLI